MTLLKALLSQLLMAWTYPRTEPLNLSSNLSGVKISKFLEKYFIKYAVRQCIIVHKSIEPKTEFISSAIHL